MQREAGNNFNAQYIFDRSNSNIETRSSELSFRDLAEGSYKALCKIRISKSDKKEQCDSNTNEEDFQPPIDLGIDLKPRNYTESEIELIWNTRSRYAYNL